MKKAIIVGLVFLFLAGFFVHADQTIMSIGGFFGIGVTPTKPLHVIGDANITGTIHYGNLEAQSPHSFVEDGRGETRICMRATNQSIVLAKLIVDRGKYIWDFEQDALACINKEVLVVKNRTAVREKVFR